MPHVDDEVWFRAGLRFSCTRCGHCCTGEPGYVWVNDAELAAIAELRHEPLAEAIALYTKAGSRGRTLREKANGDCVFYDGAAGCTIYSVRPRQCRTWPFWESNLSTPQAWERVRRICPGAGQGDVIAPEEITARMRAIPL